MNTSKIIKGVVGGGKYTVTAPIIKEDYGLYLKIEGLELPPTYEVDFSNSEHNGTSVTMIGNSDGVLIPSQFIKSGKDVFAFLYHVGEDFGRTIYKFRIPNKLRPDRTDEQPTPEEQSTIDQAISALNTAVEQTAQDVIDADASAQSASQSAENAHDSAVDAQNYAESASGYASDAQGYANTASAKADAITGLTATAQTLPSGSSATASYDAQTGVLNLGIPKGKDGTNGIDGDDGYSPTANVSKSGKVATITITDKTGTTSAQVEDGTDGTDGISPTVSITPITGGHRITITDADGEHSADVMDGTGNVDDVQINGTSIVDENGVANVPMAGSNTFGVIKANTGFGFGVMGNGSLYLYNATNSELKGGTNAYKAIKPESQHKATFYGLAKAAGDSTQSASSNAVGTYTEDAKIAIQKMLGIYEAPWELINEETFTYETETDHVIATDSNGEAFELTEALLMFETPIQSTPASKGMYGQIGYWFNNGYRISTESGAWTQNADATATRALFSYAKIDGGLVFACATQPLTSGSAANWRTRYSRGLSAIGNPAQGIQFSDTITLINRIVIHAVTGTGHYKLYGRRK